MENEENFLEKLNDIEKRKLLRLIHLEVENELLFNYIKTNKLPFCLTNIKPPFDIKFHTSAILIGLIEMIKNNELILNEKK